jgi:hypothetical protein
VIGSVGVGVTPVDFFCGIPRSGVQATIISNKVPRHMNNKQHTRNFTRSDDALILEQPVTRIGVKILARMLHTSQERVMHRADELGVSLAISDDHDGLSTRKSSVLDSSTRY